MLHHSSLAQSGLTLGAYTDRMVALPDAIAAGPVVLDGGLGTLLAARGHDLSSSLWSARLLVERPEAIRAAHEEYFAAGARVAITSSYQVSYEGLDAVGHDRAAVDLLLARSVSLAREARDRAGLTSGTAWVAASVGPFGAVRADGSEYTGEYGLTTAELIQWHRPRLDALAASEPDVIAVETIPSLTELEAICELLGELRLPAWVSVTIDGETLRSGDALSDAVALAAGVSGVFAVGVNCCDATDVAAALAVVDGAGKPGVAYPNSGEHWHAGARTWHGEPSDVPSQVSGWIDGGARLVGGCCRIGPGQIEEIAGVVGRLDRAALSRSRTP